MDLSLSRRSFAKLVAGTTAGAAMMQLGRTAALATPTSDFRAMIGIYLGGGNDGWNMVVPTDSPRYAAYGAARGSSIALPMSSLTPLPGSNYALNNALAPLLPAWNDGALGLVLNTGTLYEPLTKAQYLASPDVRPRDLMSHSDQEEQWMGNRVRESNPDGFMGRLGDRMSQTSLPALMSFGGGSLAQVGKTSSSLSLGGGIVSKEGVSNNAADPVAFAENSAITTFADTTGTGTITATTGSTITSAYSQIVLANSVLSPSTSSVDSYFVDPSTGGALNSGIAGQLLRCARMIAAHDTLGQSRQAFIAQQGAYDTHVNQVSQQAGLLSQLGLAIAAFYNAMKAIGLAQNVTVFTMTEFGRVYRGNGQAGADHAWGNNHLVIGGGLKPKMSFGTYPSQVLGGADDVVGDGRFLPTTSVE